MIIRKGQWLFIYTPEDMDWFRTVHKVDLAGQFSSAVVYGNEAYPDKIEFYLKVDPQLTDPPDLILERKVVTEYVPTGGLLHKT